MDNDGNRRMHESIMDKFDPTIYEPLRRKEDDDDDDDELTSQGDLLS